jgi:uncharacterized membrane protein
MKFISSHFYIFLSILFAVTSQLIIKWKMSAFEFNDYVTMQDKITLALSMLANPYIVLSLVLTLFSGLSWMIAMTKFEISYAYPFTVLSLVFVTIFSVQIFGETVSFARILGILLVILGIFVISQST